MTWRRFVELLGGLSPRSLWVLAARRRGPKRISGSDVDAYFESLGELGA